MTTVSTRRFWLAGAAAVALAARAQAAGYDAVVGRGGHPTIAAALAAAPQNGVRPYRILVRSGVWTEKLTIDKPNIHLIGESRGGAQISFGAFAGQIAPDGQPWGTRRSATLTVSAPGFAARNLTIGNSFDLSRGRPEGASAFQAVALALVAGSDRVQIEDVDIAGFQDTLLTDAGRALFRRCRISGTVDFIFGAGTAFFDRCEIVSRFRQMPGEGRMGYLAAPSTLIDQRFGLVFDRCRLTREAGVPNGSVALGRPWRPTTTFPDGRYGNPRAVGQAAFLRCWMDSHIDAKGWDPMAYNGKDGQRVWLQPADARFSEFDSRGPGAIPGPERRQLNADEASAFKRGSVLGGWATD